MLNATDLRNGAVFKEDNQLWQVLTYEHVKMGRGSGTIKVKVKNHFSIPYKEEERDEYTMDMLRELGYAKD